MTKYLISFDDGAMTFPEEELPDVADAVRVVREEAKAAGVWVFSGGLEHQVPSVVATDGTVTDGPYPESKEHLGGFAVVDVPHARRRWSGLPRSPPPAVVRKRFSSSCPTRLSDRRRLGTLGRDCLGGGLTTRLCASRGVGDAAVTLGSTRGEVRPSAGQCTIRGRSGRA